MALRFVACLLFTLGIPGVASAIPFDVVGFGDSITCWDCNDDSYLVWLETWGYVDSAENASYGVSADRTPGILSRLETWIDDGNSADLVVLLAGTVDTYQVLGGFGNQDYNPLETLGNIEDMIDLVLAESIPLLLLAPPPVLDPCASPDAPLTCDDIDGRLADLADDLALMATTKGVPFVDLFAAFQADPRFGLIADGGQHPGANSLFRNDGLHPRFDTGDLLIGENVTDAIDLIIPEPSTAVLLGCGLLGLAHFRRRKAA